MLVAGIDIHEVDGAASVCLYMNDIIHIYRTILIHPYEPHCLAQREAQAMTDCYRDCMKQHNPPDVLLVDGCGEYHITQQGLASCVGKALQIPTIGISKSFLVIPGIVETRPALNSYIVGNNGITYGYCFSLHNKSPIYISVGWNITLAKAIEVVKDECIYRIPQSLRYADHFARLDVKNSLC